MSYDPSKPADSSPLSSAEMRVQFTGLHDLILQSVTVDGVTTLPPGGSATASASLSGGVLHLSFEIPQGQPGEVSQSQLSNDLVNCQNAAVLTTLPQTSANSNNVSTLDSNFTDVEAEALRTKLNELINALR